MDYSINRQSAPLKVRDLYLCLAILALLLITLAFGFSFYQTFAADNLADVLRTKAFRGSMSTVSRASWMGWFMNFIITWTSFLGLCVTIYEFYITILYKAAQSIFDDVYEIKTSQMKGKFFGYQDYLKGLWEGNGNKFGGGLDVVFAFLYSLLPNVKAMSKYCPDRKSDKLDDADTVFGFVLKTGPVTFATLLILVLGFNGTTLEAYAQGLDAVSTAADNVVKKNLNIATGKLIQQGSGYTFVLDSMGTAAGTQGSKAAAEIYSTILARCDNGTEAFRQNLGKICEDLVFGNPVAGVDVKGPVKSLLGQNPYGYEYLNDLVAASTPEGVATGEIATEDDVANLVISMSVSPSSETYGGTGMAISIEEVVRAAAGGQEVKNNSSTAQYIHVFAKRSYKTNVNYLIPTDPYDETIDINA